MRDCADADVRLARVARGAVEPKGAADAAQGNFWEIAPLSACRRGTTVPFFAKRSQFRSRSEGRGPSRIKANQGCTRLYKFPLFSRDGLDFHKGPSLSTSVWLPFAVSWTTFVRS